MSHETLPLLAAIAYEHGFDVDAILLRVVARLQGASVMVGGVLQEAEAAGVNCRAALNVVDILSREKARITQDRGKEARGCRLDAAGLASISSCIDAAIRADVDLIVINRFGRAESDGRGLLSSLAEAVAAGIPLLTAVRPPYVEFWRRFHGGLGCELPPSVEEVVQWCEASCRQRRARRDDAFEDDFLH